MSRPGIVVMLTLILVVAGSISTALASVPPLSHKAPARYPASTPVVVTTAHPNHTPTRTPTRTSTPTHTNAHPEAPLPILSAPLYGGNTKLPEIALTFDDGPNPYYTPQILAVLQQYNVKATFFDIGYLVEDYPNIVRQEFKAGNIVADHSWSHPLLTTLSAQALYSQLARASNDIQAVTGVRPHFFRPPYGSYNYQVTTQAKSLGLSTIIWDDEARDWLLPGVSVIVSRILGLARNGAIILLHDGGGSRAQTVAALPYIITDLRSRGYTFVSIDQMIRHLTDTNAPSAGTTTPEGDFTQPDAIRVTTMLWKREPLE
jgi:peptidoglycan-N-acetylglucosamine deacetylase